MRRNLNFFTILCATLFLAVVLWQATAHGWWEPASLDVPYLDAGAGDEFLMIRLFLGVILIVALVVGQFLSRPLSQRMLLALAALSVFVILGWSITGFQRWAPGYSESAFDAVYDRFYTAREPLTLDQVQVAICPPLVARLLPDGRLLWSYTYMPSGGYGWDKRFVYSRDGTVIEMTRHGEP